MNPIARSAIPAVLPNPHSNVRADAAAQPQVSPGTIPAGVPGADNAASAASNTDRLPPVFAAKLSADDIDTLQSVDQGPVGHGKSHSPAQQARAFIADNPDFADMPFGQVVSQFAHGETPTLDTAADGTGTPVDSTDATSSDTPTDTVGTPPVDGSTPPTDTASNPPTDTSSGVPPTDTSTGTSTSTAGDTPSAGTPTDTASDIPPADSSLPSDPVPNIAGTNPDQALIDALT